MTPIGSLLMNLHRLLNARLAAGKPVRVALIGAGKFGSMFLSQVPHTPGLEVSVIVDLDRDRAREACRTVGWDAERIARTAFTDDAVRAIAGGAMDVVVEATGNPAVGIRHARAAIAAGKHVVMVNVEADVLAGPLLAEEARKAGVVYSLAYGDQPALTAEMVDWARATGFRVAAAGCRRSRRRSSGPPTKSSRGLGELLGVNVAVLVGVEPIEILLHPLGGLVLADFAVPVFVQTT